MRKFKAGYQCQEKQSYSPHDDLKEIIKTLEIQRINISVHSTKESCLPCQVTLRTIETSLAEMFFVGNKADLEEAQKAAQKAMYIVLAFLCT